MKRHWRTLWLILWIVAVASVGARPDWPVLAQQPTPDRPLLLPTPTPQPTRPAPEGAYRVVPGDTLLTVAVELDLDLADAHCLTAPDFSPDQPLVIGDLLTLLPPGQQCHRVGVGETLAGVAAQYGTSPDTLRAIAWNQIPDTLADIAVLPPDRYLRVPQPPPKPTERLAADPLLPVILRQPAGTTAAQLQALDAALTGRGALPVGGPSPHPVELAPVPADWPYGSGRFTWPLYGWLTQDYHLNHRAIDVAAPTGTLVTAADRGRVLRAGWSDQGYGNLVIIDHNIDYVTVYAHLSDVLVEAGEIVGQGAPIGRVGATGNTTGPHLHFEVRDFGRRVDPIGVLVR